MLVRSQEALPGGTGIVFLLTQLPESRGGTPAVVTMVKEQFRETDVAKKM